MSFNFVHKNGSAQSGSQTHRPSNSGIEFKPNRLAQGAAARLPKRTVNVGPRTTQIVPASQLSSQPTQPPTQEALWEDTQLSDSDDTAIDGESGDTRWKPLNSQDHKGTLANSRHPYVNDRLGMPGTRQAQLDENDQQRSPNSDLMEYGEQNFGDDLSLHGIRPEDMQVLRQFDQDRLADDEGYRQYQGADGQALLQINGSIGQKNNNAGSAFDHQLPKNNLPPSFRPNAHTGRFTHNHAPASMQGNLGGYMEPCEQKQYGKAQVAVVEGVRDPNHDHTHDGAPFSAPSNKRAAMIEELDFTEEELRAMSYSTLAAQAFEDNSEADSSIVPTELIGPNKLGARLSHFSTQSSVQQAKLFSEMPADEWELAGDWFLDQFGEILSKMKEARKSKRNIGRAFEEEIAKRQEAVEKKTSDMTAEEKFVKQKGKELLAGTPKAKRR